MFDEYIEFMRKKSWLPDALDVETGSKIDGVLKDDATLTLLFNELMAGVAPQDEPLIIVVAGSPGSGKTTYRKQHLAEKVGFALRDIDEVIIRLPGYRADLAEHGATEAFIHWWRVALQIAEAVFQFALEKRLNVIYDRTCGSDIALLSLRNAKQIYKYRIEMYGFYVPVEIAEMRVKQRYLREQSRIVTDKIIRGHWEGFSALWPLYLEFVDSARLFDNTAEKEAMDGEFPLICSFSQGVGLAVQSKTVYEDFLSPGKRRPLGELFPALQQPDLSDR